MSTKKTVYSTIAGGVRFRAGARKLFSSQARFTLFVRSPSSLLFWCWNLFVRAPFSLSFCCWNLCIARRRHHCTVLKSSNLVEKITRVSDAEAKLCPKLNVRARKLCVRSRGNKMGLQSRGTRVYATSHIGFFANLAPPHLWKLLKLPYFELPRTYTMIHSRDMFWALSWVSCTGRSQDLDAALTEAGQCTFWYCLCQ